MNLSLSTQGTSLILTETNSNAHRDTIHTKLQIDAVTDRILRIHSASDTASDDEFSSFAIEKRPTLTGHFTTAKTKQGYEASTDFLSLTIDNEQNLTIYDQNHAVICKDYTGETASRESLSAEDLDLLSQEGHVIPDQDHPCSYLIRKQLFGDEHIYGLGDKTGFLDKKGYDYVMWNSDNPDPHVENPTFKALYKSIPFFIVLRPHCVYGIFVDNPHKSFFDMGYESVDYYSFSAALGNLDYYFISGQDMAEVITSYTMLTGRAPLPQLWTLGYHQSRWSYRSQDEVMALAKMFRKHHIPCDAIHLDIDYMERFKVFTSDPTRFPDLTKLSDHLAKLGIKLVTIIDPGVKVEKGYALYEDGVQNGYFAQTPSGDIYQNVVWPGDSVYPDFTSQSVRHWWGSQTAFQVQHHIRGIWNDMNEPASFRGPLPDDVTFPGDSDSRVFQHQDIHNVYGHLMSKATYDGLKQLDKRRPFVITRACYSGTQKYATAWTGDNQSLWCHLKMSIPQLLNLGLSGMPFVGTDIGGFGANTTPELLCRWIEASCFAPLFRNHSAKYTRRQEPWQFDKQTLEINRKYIQLRYHFLPYLYDLCYQESQNGLPILRPLVLHYSDDPKVAECNDEYLVGDAILVAPITEQGATIRPVYLPEGLWINYWTNERIEGKTYILQDAPLDYCPIYIKAGSILPTFPPMESIEPSRLTTLILQVYPDKNNLVKPYVHYQDNGEDFEYQNGMYNLYQFQADMCTDITSEIQTIMLHQGYERSYSEIQIKQH